MSGNPEMACEENVSKRCAFDDLTKEELIAKCKGLLHIAHKAKQSKSEFQNEVKSYQNQLQICNEEKELCKKNLLTLQELVDSLTEQKLNYISEIDATYNQIKIYKEKCSYYENEIKNYKDNIEDMSSNAFNNAQKLSQFETEITSLKRQNNRLLEENETLIRQLNEMEAKVIEFNSAGLQQQEQLVTLEKRIHSVENFEDRIKSLNLEIQKYQLENKEITTSLQIEKEKKEKAYVKLKGYKEIILKCDTCVKQLKNSRYTLTAMVKEYSESVVKWQNDIKKVSELMDDKILSLRDKNSSLTTELKDIKLKYDLQTEEINSLKELLANNNLKINQQSLEFSLYNELKKRFQNRDINLNDLLETIDNKQEIIGSMHLQLKALETEKENLEKQNAYLDQVIQELKSEIKALKCQSSKALETHSDVEKSIENEYTNNLKLDFINLKEQHNLLKKEYNKLEDLNTLLKDEVETLKLSLEQPNDSEISPETNLSLQADIAKLETKLSAYKQENASLSNELKEMRSKILDLNSAASEYGDMKIKFSDCKNENLELLNEMKEINEVLKERGETISKLQKTLLEMELLIETFEKDKCTMTAEFSSLQNTNQRLNNEIEKYKLSNENLKTLITERDNTILVLKDEVEKLKYQLGSLDLPNEDNMSTSTVSKAEDQSRMKDLDDSFEEKYTKLRIFALKLKKKLNETIALLQQTEQDKQILKKLIKEQEQKTADCKDTVSSKNMKLADSVESNTGDPLVKPDGHTLEEVTDQKLFQNLKDELNDKTNLLNVEVEAHKVTKENLEKALRDLKKKNVLNLEIEAYEKSMKDLTNKLDDYKKKVVQMESTIDTQECTINSMKTQKKLLEEQIKSEEEHNRSTKIEVQRLTTEIQQMDTIIQTKNAIIHNLERDLEDEKRKMEDITLESTTLLSEKENIIVLLNEEKIALNNKIKKLELKYTEVNDKLKFTIIELEDLKTDYASYKVRAQTILRQNQTADHCQEDQLKEEITAMKVELDNLMTKFNRVQSQCAEYKEECESLKKRGAEASGEAARASARAVRLHADLAKLEQQLNTERAQHKLQMTTLTQCHKTQIADLEQKLKNEIEDLRRQLQIAIENEKPNKAIYEKPSSHTPTAVMTCTKDDNSDCEMEINVSLIPREEGEGSESAPSPPPSKAYSAGGHRSPVPLDRLLEEGVPEDEALDMVSFALSPELEIADLKKKLLSQQQKTKHLTLLVCESERECARLRQLAELLKAELRRARAEPHPHNAEYMKNVTLKFLTLPPGDERTRLVPVLQKILTLTSEETQKIQALAKGLDLKSSGGWSTYLPWPGSK